MPPSHRPRDRARRSRGLLVVAAVAVLVVGCASEPDRQDLSDALRTSGLPAAQARCVAKAIFGTLSDDQVQDLIERGAGGAPKNAAERTDDAADRLNEAMGRCRDQTAPATTEPITDEGPTTSTTEPVTSGSGPAFGTPPTDPGAGPVGTTAAP